MPNSKTLEQTLTIDGTEYYLHRDDPSNKTWWAEILEDGKLDARYGVHLFTLDLKTIHNLFEEYPKGLTKEEREIFDRENPDWKDFFSDRK